jgi:hypothetical protein
MNKVIFNESRKNYACVEMILYFLVSALGYVLLSIDYLPQNILKYLYIIFYIIAAFSLLAYFSNRRPDDYETLIFCVINVLVGTFALINSSHYNSRLILCLAILLYTLSNTINKWYHALVLDEKNDAFVISKASTTFLLAVLGLFVSIGFLSRTLIDKDFLSYYLIAFGLISLIEPFMRIIIKNDSVNKYLAGEDKKPKTIIKEKKKVSTKSKIKPEIKKKTSSTKNKD